MNGPGFGLSSSWHKQKCLKSLRKYPQLTSIECQHLLLSLFTLSLMETKKNVSKNGEFFFDNQQWDVKEKKKKDFIVSLVLTLIHIRSRTFGLCRISHLQHAAAARVKARDVASASRKKIWTTTTQIAKNMNEGNNKKKRERERDSRQMKGREKVNFYLFYSSTTVMPCKTASMHATQREERRLKPVKQHSTKKSCVNFSNRSSHRRDLCSQNPNLAHRGSKVKLWFHFAAHTERARLLCL